MARRNAKGRKPAARSPYKALIAMGVVAALGLLYGWNVVFIAPQARQRTAVQKKVAAARQHEQELRGQLAQLKKVAADTQSREAELARLNRLIPADADVAGAILLLNDTATQAQVQWSSFVPTPPGPATGGGPLAMGVSMKIVGTFPQVFDYLARLETLDRLVVVDSIQLTGSPVQNGPTRIDADIKARMFAAGTGTAAPSGTAVSTRTGPTTATTAPNPAAGPGTLAGGKPAGTAATAAALTKAGG